ncbi:hypothetical protein DICPUDRAFT_77309 [Dictyostelium purpureum]|uniref:EGF-like domain-containing protein n=1 Tax=Dictyostelium purpureum TaxID=5786 RepID=F0ZG85_DICPU|nr:uncharacterized protein DICPUDRAFT_77309 [Dictyostelium purpureum]EGC37075.1 hypothetical protein DICPUDRAFT_77309 [Dictyostelium purpureum]|eukprot:XP_003286432.1 hypothetical protein DICPUDRAFT_77309 [Dictyostelium purpureum]
MKIINSLLLLLVILQLLSSSISVIASSDESALDSSEQSLLCPGVPMCGGPEQGECINQMCRCHYPWVGFDCLSKIIIIDPPTLPPGVPSICVDICNGHGRCSSDNLCICDMGWGGPYCNTSLSSSSSSSIVPPILDPIIVCNSTNNGLVVDSYTGINCTANGPMECVDNYSGSTCSTENQGSSSIKCTVGSHMSSSQRHSITCIGSDIKCVSSFVRCGVKLSAPGSLYVNDIQTNSNIVMFNQDSEQIYLGEKSETSSVFSQFNILSILSLSFLLLSIFLTQ